MRYYSVLDNSIGKYLSTPRQGGVVVLGDGSEVSLKMGEIIDEMDGLKKWGKEVWNARKKALDNANTRKTLIRKYKLENLND